MFYFLVIVAAFGWVAAGLALGFYANERRLRMEVVLSHNDLSYANIMLRDELDAVDEALVRETRIATDMQEERDNAHKMLEFVLSDENLKELSK